MKRTKVYGAGDRLNVYLKQNVSENMLNWINKQSDLTTFFLYAAQQLYEKTGNVDIAEILPRKYDFNLDGIQVTPVQVIQPAPAKQEPKSPAWSGLENIEEDPYA
ncbi:hypothetical protein [Ectobacillus antri]|jgi:hypothetical protein|uniref:hypothetical protein n=1 Tax=Ectobacillus antri TaxID=2486280 RepID=UPI000F592BEC|nr:hypothetical protein [Ectobacillus antri]